MFLFGFVHNMLMENTEINTPSTWAYDLYGQVSFKNMPWSLQSPRDTRFAWVVKYFFNSSLDFLSTLTCDSADSTGLLNFQTLKKVYWT